MNKIKTLFRKEAASYLNSSVALIFLGTFLVLTLFTFFFWDKFFERNIADVRPLFHWLPILLIFLVSALTMRSWAEEKSQGTIELLLTWPVQIFQLVVGKFFGVMLLVAMALAITLPLPITVSFIGELDWGPVLGGYLGALLVAAAYAAIGLWISSFTANQIVALFLTGITCSIFYIVGSNTFVHLAPNRVSEILLALGTGSRFESIARGVIDLRDLVYYGSLALFFGMLNVFSLVRGRWSQNLAHIVNPLHQNWVWAVVLVFANLLVLNFWLAPINFLRLDLTARGAYTVSPATKRLVQGLNEPLIIKFYSSETHPLLKPLIPQVRDLIQEYEVVSKGKISGEFLDPSQDEEIEREANQDYGIRPVPFQVPGRHEYKIVNSYFDILILYGDQKTTLSFGDLIEISVSGMNDINVQLRNLEYDLTRSIKKVVYGFQGLDEVFAKIEEPIQAQFIYTSKTLPPRLKPILENAEKIFLETKELAGEKFSYEIIDLDQDGAKLTRKQMLEDYGLRAFSLNPLISKDTFYVHTILTSGENKQVLIPVGDFSEKEMRAQLERFLKRQAKGILKTVGFWAPPPKMPAMPLQFRGRTPPPQGDTYKLLHEQLRADYRLEDVNLKDGIVANNIDVLVILQPREMETLEKAAIDQFLMKGGSVLVATGSFEMVPGPQGGLGMEKIRDGMHDLLKHYGIEVQENLVMDLQNEKFPIPVTRDLGGFSVREIKLIPYPFFVDVRSRGMAKSHPALSGLPSLTLNWSSSLRLDPEKLASGQITPLIHSSEKSWVQYSSQIQPNFKETPEFGFRIPQEFQKSVLVATRKGPIESYFTDKDNPYQSKEVEDDPIKKLKLQDKFSKIIKSSPTSARLMVIGSGNFIGDNILAISRNSGQERYVNSLQFLQNLIDWSVEDIDLLTIRSRGRYARTLVPLEKNEKFIIEIVNYVIVLLSLVAIGVFTRIRRKRVKPLVFPRQGEGSHDTHSIQEEKAA